VTCGVPLNDLAMPNFNEMRGVVVQVAPLAQVARMQTTALQAGLARYNALRDFGITAEPPGEVSAEHAGQQLRFVVQKHWASSLDYDFRLELDGVMLNWAVPKGPSLNPGKKQLAVQVEDHPLAYNTFEGEIQKGQYGAGRVIVWDQGIGSRSVMQSRAWPKASWHSRCKATNWRGSGN